MAGPGASSINENAPEPKWKGYFCDGSSKGLRPSHKGRRHHKHEMARNPRLPALIAGRGVAVANGHLRVVYPAVDGSTITYKVWTEVVHWPRSRADALACEDRRSAARGDPGDQAKHHVDALLDLLCGLESRARAAEAAPPSTSSTSAASPRNSSRLCKLRAFLEGAAFIEEERRRREVNTAALKSSSFLTPEDLALLAETAGDDLPSGLVGLIKLMQGMSTRKWLPPTLSMSTAQPSATSSSRARTSNSWSRGRSAIPTWLSALSATGPNTSPPAAAS